jgi:hypothetical protein
MDRRHFAAAAACLALVAACAPGPSGTSGCGTFDAAAATGTTGPRSTGSVTADPTPAGSPSERPAPSAVDVVQAFYDWYLEGQEVEAVLARPDLSPAMVDFVRGHQGTNDPFVCSNLVPTDVRAVTASSSGRTAIVSTIVSYDAASEEPGPAVDLVLSEDGEWQLEFIGCQA